MKTYETTKEQENLYLS